MAEKVVTTAGERDHVGSEQIVLPLPFHRRAAGEPAVGEKLVIGTHRPVGPCGEIGGGVAGISHRDVALQRAGGDEFEGIDAHPIRRDRFRGAADTGVFGAGCVAAEVAAHQFREGFAHVVLLALGHGVKNHVVGERR